jgi:hypothetical protein
VDRDFFRFPLGPPFPPAVLEGPDQFFLFRVHGDHGLLAAVKRVPKPAMMESEGERVFF